MVIELPVASVRSYVSDAVAEPPGAHRTRLVEGWWSWTALAASLSRFDAEIEVVRPPELARAFAVIAQRAARAATHG